MEAEMMSVIRKNLFRAVSAIAMDTSVAENIWAEMTGTPVVQRQQQVEVPGMLAAAPATEVDYEALGRMPGGMSTPKRPTKPVEPRAPERPVKPAEEESEEEKEDTKLSPQQKLEKQRNTTTEKLDKLRARQGTAKQTAKQKEADPKEIAKLEEKLKEVTAKLEKFAAKAQKPNFEKWTPTWTKHFKTAADAAKMQVSDDTKSGFVQYLNALTPEEFKKPSYLEHATRYFQQRAAAGVGLLPDPAEKEEAPAAAGGGGGGDDDDEEVYEVTYDGELYTVGEHSRKVYKVTEEGDVPVTHLDDIKAVLSKLDKQLGK